MEQLTGLTALGAIELLTRYRKERDDAITTVKRRFIAECNVLDNIAVTYPHNIGDVVKVKTLTYAGKEIIITKRGVVNHPAMNNYQMIGYEGFILNKNGSPSKRSYAVPVSHYLNDEGK